MTTLTLSAHANSYKSKTISFPGLSLKALYLFGAILLLSMLIFYSININELTRGTYLIKSYNKEIKNLSAQNSALEANFAESGFLGGVMEKAKALNFEKTTEITYIEILESPVAKAK